jgi:inner membrane protein
MPIWLSNTCQIFNQHFFNTFTTMDSLTQIVLGAAVAEAVAGKKLGAKAALLGAIGGTIPDLDVFFTGLFHPLDAALVHRGISHSLLFAVVVSPVLAWLSHRLSKRRHDYRMWLWLWGLSIVTHPMLDMFTNYGTQFFWPLDARITFNTVFVIDPIYTVPFLLCLIVALFKKRTDPARRKWNNAGIIWSTGYLLIGVIIKLSIWSNVDSYPFADKPTREMVTPMPLTSFYWLIVTENKDSYQVGYKSVFGAFKREEVEVIPKNHALLKRLKWKGKDRAEQIRFLTNGYYSLRKSNDTLYCYDLRFGTTTQLTAGKVTAPLMGYGMIVDNGVVQKTFRLQRGNAFKAVNFGRYIDKVFGK